MTIKYISHGKYETGGYYLEKSFCDYIGGAEEIRFRKNFKGLFGWISLFLKAFIISEARISITVVRLAWPVWLRNWRSGNKIIVVIHNYDTNDGKPYLYYLLLNKFLSIAKNSTNKIAIVVVSESWKMELKKQFYLDKNIFVFPNLFNNSKLRFYSDLTVKRDQLIHLGQYSSKIDTKSYRLLLYELNKLGFICYFSSMHELKNVDFPITVFRTHEAYLKQMASARCTVIMNKIKEGWNRVAHESLLVGTQVLAYPLGGLKELLEIGNGHGLTHLSDILELVISGRFNPINFENLDLYDNKNGNKWAQPIKDWMNTDDSKT